MAVDSTATGAMRGGPLTKASQIKRTSSMVMIFDGLRMLDAQAARISARHNAQKYTNILLADGHAASFRTKDLPQVDEALETPNSGGTDPWERGFFYKDPQWRMDHP